MKTLLPLIVVLCVLFFTHHHPLSAAPANDTLAGATVISIPGDVTQSDVASATFSAGEPPHSCSVTGLNNGLNTVWFRFTLAQTGTVTIATDQSDYKSTKNTLVSIYNSSLQEVACGDNTPFGDYAIVDTPLQAGTYTIKVSNGSATPLEPGSTLRLRTYFVNIILPTVTPSHTPSATLTLTETPLPTSVGSTLSPTQTLFVTPTPVELVVNGDFEQDSEPDRVPDSWQPKYLFADKRICNKPDKIVAHTGQCSFQFKGSLGERSKLQQTLSGVQKGDRLLLSAAINTGGIGLGKVVFAKLKYSETDAGVFQNGKDQIKLELTNPTQGYQVLEERLTVDGTPTKFTIIIRFRGVNGKLRVDAVSLKKLQG